jgi:hypothetical protein
MPCLIGPQHAIDETLYFSCRHIDANLQTAAPAFGTDEPVL